MWLLIITRTYALSSGGTLMTGHDEYPFADHQECIEAAAQHNEMFDRIRQGKPNVPIVLLCILRKGLAQKQVHP